MPKKYQKLLQKRQYHSEQSGDIAFVFSVFSNNLQVVCIGESGIHDNQVVGIPVRHRRNIVLQWVISLSASPAQRLNGHSQILFKIDGIGDMPAVHIEIALRFVGLVDGTHLGKSRVGGGKFHVFTVHIKIIGSAEIVLGSRAANAGELGISVDVELDLALTPPSVGLDAPKQIGSHVVTLSLDIIKDHIILLIGQRIDPSELGVKIKAVLGDRFLLAVDLIVDVASRVQRFIEAEWNG